MAKRSKSSGTERNSYKALIEKIFFDRYVAEESEISFSRSDIPLAAKKLRIDLPKNLGDVIYSIRYRTSMPESILKTQSEGMEWIIESVGRSKYSFKLVRKNRILPNRELITIKIPDSTPEMIVAYALSDEQALLAKVRYNRLIDIFLGIATYSLQNHLRTTVKDVGQIEIDEIYVGIDSKGRQFVLPVQAKGGKDQLSSVQTRQDIACCSEKFQNLVCRPVSVQFMESDLIAMFELAIHEGEVRVVDEKHYRLVPSEQISQEDLKAYNSRS